MRFFQKGHITKILYLFKWLSVIDVDRRFGIQPPERAAKTGKGVERVKADPAVPGD
jgi:hypothetical protein